jgi:hypothetical protein
VPEYELGILPGPEPIFSTPKQTLDLATSAMRWARRRRENARQMRRAVESWLAPVYALPKANGGIVMRMMLKIIIPTEAGNRTIKDGSLPKVLEATMSKLNAEAAYFVAQDGLRNAMIFFDMRDSSDIPSIVEPLFIGLDAEVELLPVMNADDLRKGMKAAMEAM